MNFYFYLHPLHLIVYHQVEPPVVNQPHAVFSSLLNDLHPFSGDLPHIFEQISSSINEGFFVC